MSYEDVLAIIDRLPEADADVLMRHSFAMTPWQGSPPGSLSLSSGTYTDEDGFTYGMSEDDFTDFVTLQRECWNLYRTNGFVFTTMQDLVGRLCGHGFSQFSPYERLNDFMDKVWHDPRNMLVSNFSDYVLRGIIQGETYLAATVHNDGFVEVDFIAPTLVSGFTDGSGILFAKNKPNMPLLYKVNGDASNPHYIPDINLAYYPELWAQIESSQEWGQIKDRIINSGKGRDDLHKCQTFMLRWEQGAVTKRNIGRVRASMEWINHYINLKKWEMDHKKSSGSYLWHMEFEDVKAWKLWLALSEEQRLMTGLMQTKTPGMTVMTPPGMKLEVKNPQLSSITNQDNDILKMISAGLNVPEDMMTGSSSGITYGGAKLSRGPIADRIKNDVVDLERWLINVFWQGSFYLHHLYSGANWTYKSRKAYKFDGGKAKFKVVTQDAYRTIAVTWPLSEMSDLEGTTRAVLGVKHGPVTEQLGISCASVSRRLGYSDYYKERLDAETEKATFPELAISSVIESAQAQLGEGSQHLGTQEAPEEQ